MDKQQAKQQTAREHEINIQTWTDKAVSRAAEKIRIYTGKGKSECELDLKYPPKNPDDQTSMEVAERFVAHFEGRGYSVQLIQRVNHLGAICRVKWD